VEKWKPKDSLLEHCGHGRWGGECHRSIRHWDSQDLKVLDAPIPRPPGRKVDVHPDGGRHPAPRPDRHAGGQPPPPASAAPCTPYPHCRETCPPLSSLRTEGGGCLCACLRPPISPGNRPSPWIPHNVIRWVSGKSSFFTESPFPHTHPGRTLTRAPGAVCRGGDPRPGPCLRTGRAPSPL